MKGLLAAFAMVTAVILLFGCVSDEAKTNQNAGQNADNSGQNTAAATSKVIFSALPQLPDGKVGTYYEYSFCSPAPGGKNDLCGGINPTANPSGGKGPYTFYLGSGAGFQPFGLSLSLNGILSGTPTAAGIRSFQICAKDIGGDFACQPVSVNIKPSEGLAGVWEMDVHSVLNGPDGSFPAGCSMEQKMQLNLTQNGNAVGGTATNRMTKTTGCGIWSVDIETPDKSALSGTISGSSVKFTMGQTDFTGAISGGNMTGTMATCSSPDPRCTCKSPDPRCPAQDINGDGNLQPVEDDTVNWYAGDFTAVRVG